MRDPDVDNKIAAYPDRVRRYANEIRNLIYNVAKVERVGEVRESLKWGEPSFTVVNGSPVRMDWKPDNPEKFFLFFNCNTSLVDTFREVYGHLLQFEGNRAIVLDLSEQIPNESIGECISMALRYHRIKKMPLLGA